MYYMIAPTGSDLYHHGILGQKWGRKNGPPYPLGSGDHSTSEKKAGWKNSLKKASLGQKIRQKIHAKQYQKDSEQFKKNKANLAIAKRDQLVYTKEANKTSDIQERRDLLSNRDSFNESNEYIEKWNKKLLKKYGEMKIDTSDYDREIERLDKLLSEETLKSKINEYKIQQDTFDNFVKTRTKDIKEYKKKVPKDVQDYIDNNKFYDLETRANEYERYLKDPEKWKQKPDRY